MSDEPSGPVGFAHPRYILERELGRGGMATVFRARDVERNRVVALKILHEDLANGAARDRFIREIRLAGEIVHPHILPVLDAGESNGRMFYTMPCVDGESLRQRIDREGQLSIAGARRIVADVAAALDHAHAAGIVHRDIKPENILLAGDNALVSDFGVARAVDQAADDRVTSTGMILGTPAYMSPEQATGGVLDGRTDIYSLGAVAYEMVTGHSPFAGSNARQLMARLVVDSPPPIRTVRPGCPPSIEQAIARAMAKDPSARFTTAGELSAAMAADLTTSVQSRQRTRLIEVIGVAAVVLAVSVFLAMELRDGPEVLAAVPVVAVLPFSENEADQDDPYLAYTLREDVASMLSGSGAVRVVRVAAPSEGSDFLLSGSIRRDSDARVVSLSLSRSGESTPMFRTEAQARHGELRLMPATLASRVIAALGGSVEGERFAAMRSSLSATTPEAFDLYLRGRYQLSRRTSASAARALTLFTEAARLDSSFARAWAWLAFTASWSRFRGFTIPGHDHESLLVLALSSVDRAIELDPNDSEVQVTRARIAVQIDPATRGAALAAVQRAIVTDSMNADAWRQLGLIRDELLQPDAAAAALQRAVMIDPAHLEALAFLALNSMWSGRFREGLRWADSAIAVDATYLLAREAASHLAIELGRLDSAERHARVALQLTGGRDQVQALVLLARIAALRGERDSAQVLIRRATILIKPPITLHESVELAAAQLAAADTAGAIRTLRSFGGQDDLHFLLHLRRDPPLQQIAAAYLEGRSTK